MKLAHAVATFVLLGMSVPSYAQDAGAPASPSGAPAAAAEHGSSNIGKKAATNEMSSHMKNAKRQKTMANPHKVSR